jgi:hypothetical protein
MAESIIQLNTGSGGPKAHTFNRTIGANSVEDEVVLLGENYLASYIAHPNANLSTATAASHIFQVMAGASLKVRIRRIEVYQSVLATTVSFIDLQLWRLSSAGTGGTAVTPALLDTTDAASGFTLMTLPTAKGTETTLVVAQVAILVQTLGTGTFAAPIAIFDFDRLRSKPLTIAAGATNGIALKNGGGVAGASVSVNVIFDESNF